MTACEPTDLAEARDQLVEVLALIDGGVLLAEADQREQLRGAVAALTVSLTVNSGRRQ